MIYRHRFTNEDLDLFYLDTQEHKPVILCLHGLFGRGQGWYQFIQEFQNHYRIIAPDQRGHGLSFRPASYYTGREMAEDALSLLDHLKISKAIIYGHSMGAEIAAHLATQAPKRVKALVLLDMPASGPKDKALTLEPLTQKQLFDGWPESFSTYQDVISFLSNTQPSELSVNYFKDSIIEKETGFEFMFDRNAMTLYKDNYRDWSKLLSQIQCPTLIIRAKNSNSVSDEELQRMLALNPYALSKDMTSSDHNVHTSNPTLFYNYCHDFMGSLQE